MKTCQTDNPGWNTKWNGDTGCSGECNAFDVFLSLRQTIKCFACLGCSLNKIRHGNACVTPLKVMLTEIF